MIYPALLAIGVFACAWIGWRTWNAPDHASRPLFLATALFGACWTFMGLLIALAPDAGWLLFWTNLAPIVIVPTYWYTMAFILSHIGAIPRRWNLAVHLGIGAWTVFLLILHQVPALRWLFADYGVAETAEGLLLVRQAGVLYGPVLGLNLAVYLATTGFVVRAVIRSARIHRRQNIGMLAGTLLPFAVYVGQAALVTEMDPRVDLMVLSFVPACVTFFWLTIRQQLLTIAPIPRHSLMDAIPDAILVLDDAGRILEANRAASGLGGLAGDSIGGSIADVPDLAAAVMPYLGTAATEADVRLATGTTSGLRDLALAVTPYKADKRASGTMLMFRDVTERSRLERHLQIALHELQEKLSENLQLQEQLREQAMRDQLTGLYNRYHCNTVHPVLMAEALASGRPLAAVLMDVDHFKAVNDQLGHAAGDEVLCILADVLRAVPVDGGSVYRYGGEEFLALLPDTEAEAATAVAAAWRAAFRRATVSRPTIGRPVDFSAGVAVFPRDADTWPVLVNDADLALYAAKAAGRGRTVVWGNGVSETAPTPVAAASRREDAVAAE